MPSYLCGVIRQTTIKQSHKMKIIGSNSRCLTISRIQQVLERYPAKYCSVVRPSGIVIFIGTLVPAAICASDEDTFLHFFHSRPISEKSFLEFKDFARFAGSVGV